MPYFRVLIEGAGLDIRRSDDEPSIVGFVVSRDVYAKTATEASSMAVARIAEEWREGAYSHYAAVPSLEASEVRPISLLRALLRGHRGYVFYADSQE